MFYLVESIVLVVAPGCKVDARIVMKTDIKEELQKKIKELYESAMENIDENTLKEFEKQYGIKVHIELEMRWRATIDRIKELIADGRLGEVTSFCAYNYSHFPMWWTHWVDIPEQSYGKRIPLYEGAKRFRGGALTDHPHIIDMARYILDSEFESVYAEAAPNMRDAAETEDMVYIIGKMQNGVIVSLDPSYANRELEQCRRYGNRVNHYPRTVQVELEIHGTKGSILCDAYGANLVEELSGEDFEYTVQQKWYDIITGRYAFLTNFARNILYGDAYCESVSLEEHKKSIQVINACYDSIYSGKVQKL